MEIKLDKRHIIAMISRGFLQTPQDIMEEYNGCSVPQYTRYRRVDCMYIGYPEC
jgi:hypothetical protein